jgi:hypothetical protein
MSPKQKLGYTYFLILLFALASALLIAPAVAQEPMPPVEPPVEPPPCPACPPVCPVCPPAPVCPPPPPPPPAVPCEQKPIASAKFTRQAGHAYVARIAFGTTPDKIGDLKRSKLKLFENGVEMGPAHSKYKDIEALGKGRFLHWKAGTEDALWMSATDNSNPITNGKAYTYCIGLAP